MAIKFDPNNSIIRLCMIGMSQEEKGGLEEAAATFHKAWSEAEDDYERFLAAYHVARLQKDSTDKLKWMETALKCAQTINDVNVTSAYAALYLNIAECFETLRDDDNANRYYALAEAAKGTPSDKGPFYHGTRADLLVGDLLVAGGISNYQPELKMNHIYFTANINGAGLAAVLAKGDGRERIYIVEPTGEFENDPNVTDKKFPGNLTRSYRSAHPLKIIGEVAEWSNLTPEERRQWQEKLAENKGEIIN